jgi:hypothetical protein
MANPFAGGHRPPLLAVSGIDSIIIDVWCGGIVTVDGNERWKNPGFAAIAWAGSLPALRENVIPKAGQ